MVLMGRAAPPASATSPVVGSRASGRADGIFEKLHADTAKPLWRYVFRMAGNAAVADDVVQESFLRILSRVDQLGDLATARPYLYRIASNLLRDRWRRDRRDDRGASVWGGTEPKRATDLDIQADVQAVLALLPERQRAILWLAHVDGYAHAEIARILDLRPASVKVLLHRAKSKLVSLLAAEGYSSHPRNRK